MAIFTWWKRSSSRSLVHDDAQSPRPPSSHPLYKSQSVQNFSNSGVAADSSSYYSSSLYSSPRPSSAMSRLQRYSSLRNLSMSSRSSNYTDPSSVSTAPVHVDILDAQGKFKPSDFRGRVEASGIRDYGEDVAERNLGQNGVQLFSPAVKLYYANLPKDRVRLRKHSYPVSILEDPEETETQPPTLQRTQSLSSTQRPIFKETERPGSRNSMFTFPTKNVREATSSPVRGRRLSTLSIGNPTLETSSIEIVTPDRSSSPPAIRRNRLLSGIEYGSTCSRESRPQTAHTGIHDLSMWHSVQMAQDVLSEIAHEEDYESDDSMAYAISEPRVTTVTSTHSHQHQPLETLAELSDYTTDGSDIEAYIEKRRRHNVPDGEALLFDDDCFGGEAHGSLPGLFDAMSEPDVPDTIPEDEEEADLSTGESVPTPTFPSSVFVSQRDRLLALGFDYESEDDSVLEAAEACEKNPPTPALGLGIVKDAVARRKQTKRQHLGQLKHNRRARRRWGVEDDGNEADVE